MPQNLRQVPMARAHPTFAAEIAAERAPKRRGGDFMRKHPSFVAMAVGNDDPSMPSVGTYHQRRGCRAGR